MSGQIVSEGQIRQENELNRVMEGLDVGQSIALQILMSGGTVTAAAAGADVSRQAIYLWLAAGHPFRVALDLWKRDLAQCARTRLVMMTDLATSNVALALKRGDTRTALTLLEKLGVLALTPVGDAVEEVRRERVETKGGMERADGDSTAESLAEVGLWNEEFGAARMARDSAEGEGSVARCEGVKVRKCEESTGEK